MISKLFFSHRCYHGGPMHRFEPRCSIIGVPAGADKMTLFFTEDEYKADVLKAMTGGKKLYRGDVCVWCGKVVNEQAAVREA